MQASRLLNAYKGISKEIWLLAIAMLINRSGSMILLFMSVYLTHQKHFTLSQAGTIMSLFGLGSLLGAYLGGVLNDKIGFFYTMILSLVLSGITIISLGFLNNFYFIATATFLVTSTGDMFRPANAASISSYAKPEAYTQAIALNRLAMNIGFVIGPMLGGFLAGINYFYLFIADGLTCISAALFIYLALPAKKHQKASHENNTSYFTVLKDKPYMLFLFLCMIYAVCFFQLLTALPLYYKKVYHLPESSIGWLMALNGAGVAILEMFFIYYVKNRWPEKLLIQWGILLLILAFLTLNTGHYLGLLIINMILLTLSEMAAMPFMSTWSMKSAKPSKMGQYMALYSMSWSLALIIAPYMGTRIIHRYGYDTLWYVVATLGLITFIGFRLTHAKDQQMQVEKPQ
mgnify:CR=1 FL=1